MHATAVWGRGDKDPEGPLSLPLVLIFSLCLSLYFSRKETEPPPASLVAPPFLASPISEEKSWSSASSLRSSPPKELLREAVNRGHGRFLPHHRPRTAAVDLHHDVAPDLFDPSSAVLVTFRSSWTTRPSPSRSVATSHRAQLFAAGRVPATFFKRRRHPQVPCDKLKAVVPLPKPRLHEIELCLINQRR
jgi:hypothetical protein